MFPNYVSKTKFRYLIDAIQGGNNLIRSIQLDISTFDNTSKRSHAGTFNLTNINNWHEESFKADNLDELSAINVIKSLFSVFFNIDEKKFENRTGSGEYSFDIMDLDVYYIPLEFELYNIFLTAFLQECLISLPSYIIDNTFVDAVRANVLRMYTYKSQGTDFNDLIINYISGLKQDDNRSEYKLGTFMNKWIKEFDIADDVIFEPTEDGLGVHIFIVKDNEKILLADEGYGITQLLSIFLQIELNIIKSEYRYTHQFIMNQEVQYKASTISIEEPEVNLHPKFQSKLAEMFYDAYDK